MLGVKPGERPEGAVGQEAAVGHEDVDVRMEVEQFARGLDELHGARFDANTLEVAVEVELQGPLGTAGQFFGGPLECIWSEVSVDLGRATGAMADILAGDLKRDAGGSLTGPRRCPDRVFRVVWLFVRRVVGLIPAAGVGTPLGREGSKELAPPVEAVGEVLAARDRTGADVVLGLFPSERPDKTDMVEVAQGRVAGCRIKPGPCELAYTWILATWGDDFTRFLGAYLERTGGEVPPGSRLPELQISEVLAEAESG